MPPAIAQQLAFIPQIEPMTRRKQQRERAPAAVQVFKGIVGRWPHKSTWPAIEKAVRNGHDAPTSTDMTRWADTVKQWLAVGYNPLNVAGMLDCYQREMLPNPAQRALGPGDALSAIDEWSSERSSDTW